jgi:hypothetical protein
MEITEINSYLNQWLLLKEGNYSHGRSFIEGNYSYSHNKSFIEGNYSYLT